MAIQGTLWVFEGRSNELFFTYDLRALEQQKFFKAGNILPPTWSDIRQTIGCLEEFWLSLNSDFLKTNSEEETNGWPK